MRTDGYESTRLQLGRKLLGRQSAGAGEFDLLYAVGLRNIERAGGAFLRLCAQAIELKSEMVAEIGGGNRSGNNEGKGRTTYESSHRGDAFRRAARALARVEHFGRIGILLGPRASRPHVRLERTSCGRDAHCPGVRADFTELGFTLPAHPTPRSSAGYDNSPSKFRSASRRRFPEIPDRFRRGKRSPASSGPAGSLWVHHISHR